MIKDLSKKLKTLRLKYGYSQKQVANKADVSTSLISGYENGERTPSAEVLLSLSNIYNCSVDYLLGKDTGEHTLKLDTNGLTDEQIHAFRILIESIK